MSVILIEGGASLAGRAAKINGNGGAEGRQVCHAAVEPDTMAAQTPGKELR
jgi:hypothetical protein